MEEILAKIIVADNASIQQGTKELREAFKNPDAIPALCQTIVNSPNSQIRQSAAVLLRKRLSRHHHWSRISEEYKTGMKQLLLQTLVKEPEKLVKNSIVQLIGIVGKYEVTANRWPEILQFINTLCASENVSDKELGMYTLSIISEVAAEQYVPHMEAFGFLFVNTLNTLPTLNSSLSYYTVLTMIHFVPLIRNNQQMINVYHQLLPIIMESINAMARSDQTQACEMMELFDELIEYAVTVIVPHIKSLIELCLRLSVDKELDESIQVKAISLIGWLTRTKKKTIVKCGLVEPIVATLFQLLSLPPDDECDEAYFTGDPGDSNPMTCAAQTLDLLALNLPPEKLITPLLQHIEPALQSDNLYAKKASYLAMAVLAEGCSDCIRTKYLQSFLQCICKGIREQNHVVRNAALFALGQFSEHLQPEISKYAPELLPVLFDFLGQLCAQLQNSKEPASVDRMFYALEMFCENLEAEILPYLDTLMECLFLTLNSNSSVHLRELALSAIGATANAAKEAMLPYFPRIIEVLRLYLTNKYEDETSCLTVQAVDTLGTLASTIGAENFLPLAKESLDLGLRLLDEADDPDLRKSTYGLFASIAMVIKGDIGSLLPRILEPMLSAIKSSDGIVTHYKEEEVSALDVYDYLSESDDEEEEIENESSSDDGDAVAGYSVENAYIEEKEEACMALRDLCAFTGPIFFPYLESCFDDVFKLTNFPQEDVCKVAIEALLQFLLTMHMSETEEGKSALRKYLQLFIPRCAELIRTHEERSVVMAALDAYGSLLDEMGSIVFCADGHREAIINCVVNIMHNNTECQDKDQDINDDSEAEHDELLIESAGDIIPKFGKAVTPDDFVVYFNNLLPLLLTRMGKKQDNSNQRSLTLGVLAECMQPLREHAGKFAQPLLPLLIKDTKDAHAETRNNSIFAIGEMVLYGKEALYGHYPELLQTLSAAVSKETHPGALDNICGALAKMILTNVNAIPMEEVFPAFVQYLPLREDFEENKAVFLCISNLYQLGHSVLQNNLAPVLSAAVQVLAKNQYCNDEDKNVVKNLVQCIQRDFPDVFNNVLSTLSPDDSKSFQQVFVA